MKEYLLNFTETLKYQRTMRILADDDEDYMDARLNALEDEDYSAGGRDALRQAIEDEDWQVLDDTDTSMSHPYEVEISFEDFDGVTYSGESEYDDEDDDE